MAVREAVRAATTTFTATSTIRFVFISYILLLTSYIFHRLVLSQAATTGVASVVAVATVRTTVRATAGVASVVPIVVTRTTAAAVAVLGGVAAGEALDHRLGLRCEGELGVAVHLLDDGVAGGLHNDLHVAYCKLLCADVGMQLFVGALYTASC